MKLPSWTRRTPDTRTVRAHSKDVWWVRLILNVGRPVVAVFVLIMCAPGEHYLARQAGWSELLAWGMPGTLTAYAGIAAVVATKRPKGAEGKRTAVAGAITAIALAMAAQPIAHLYGRHSLTVQQVVLVCVISCIPAGVFGHLLHMAAAPDVRRTPDTVIQADTARTDNRTAGRPQWLADNERTAAVTGQTVSELMSAPDSPSDSARWTPDTEPSWIIKPKVSAPGVRRTTDGSMTDTALTVLRADPDATDADLKAAILDRFGQDSKPDSVSKAVRRARAKAAA